MPRGISITATRLPDGKVLVVGGFVDFSQNVGSCELYNPAAEAWVFTDSQIVASAWHTATLLNDGRVLVAGGFNNFGNATNRAEVYDPTTGLWTETGSLITARYRHTATLLQDGRVLVAGGQENGLSRLDSAEIYDPTTETWTATGYLGVARGGGHTATLLHDGRVLVIGGIELSYDGPDTNTELFDPASGTWSPTGQLNTSREDHSATLLRDGRVLLVGGSTDKENHGGPGEEASTELYDPVSGRWSPGIYMNQRRSGHTATLLLGNPLEQVVLIAGGTYDDGWLDSTEVWEDVPLFADGFETGGYVGMVVNVSVTVGHSMVPKGWHPSHQHANVVTTRTASLPCR